jgi:hypothetical protein
MATVEGATREAAEAVARGRDGGGMRRGRRCRGRAVVARRGGVRRGGRLGLGLEAEAEREGRLGGARVEVEAERVESMVRDESIEQQECEGGRAKPREAGGQTRDGGRITEQRVFYVPVFSPLHTF